METYLHSPVTHFTVLGETAEERGPGKVHQPRYGVLLVTALENVEVLFIFNVEFYHFGLRFRFRSDLVISLGQLFFFAAVFFIEDALFILPF